MQQQPYPAAMRLSIALLLGLMSLPSTLPSAHAGEPARLAAVGGGPLHVGTCGGTRVFPDCGYVRDLEAQRRAMEAWLRQEEGRVRAEEAETRRDEARARAMEAPLAVLEVKVRAQQERLLRIQEAQDKIKSTDTP